ncbi:hypothetical protein I6E09_13230 [Mediterraneibacter glycyrrhizinilyticus]|uniref:hypothetical protein n=1 Tax=Mediterraneibacter glycyrrhizinilyticus TaxID=342942 RepID=UPI002658FDAC|nr:hypothetical protein [Mediterraneibacter glycyrrhizinilyticus]MCF2570123.1 hypothetical protein [Mediterraneibacter glycyrrhizinilyticus]
MQKNIIKAGNTERYFTAGAMITYEKEREQYEGMLLIQQKGKERSRYETSDIRIFSKNKEVVYRQLKQIAALYPPKQDVRIIDTEELKDE